jgi:DNA-binding NarL/FixJ family response regulator
MGDERQPQEGQVARIVLVEDHATVRQALALVLGREPGLEVVAQAGSISEVRGLSCAEFDLAIVDLGLSDGHGAEAITELRKLNPQGKMLILSATSERTELARAVEAGASGLLHKATPLEEIPRAVRSLLAGEALLSAEDTIELLRLISSERRKDLQGQSSAQQITPREKEILQALADGLNDKEIAERLDISFDTVRNHMKSIFIKLEAGSRLQAVMFAVRHGMVEVR